MKQTNLQITGTWQGAQKDIQSKSHIKFTRNNICPYVIVNSDLFSFWTVSLADNVLRIQLSSFFDISRQEHIITKIGLR